MFLDSGALPRRLRGLKLKQLVQGLRRCSMEEDAPDTLLYLCPARVQFQDPTCPQHAATPGIRLNERAIWALCLWV